MEWKGCVGLLLCCIYIGMDVHYTRGYGIYIDVLALWDFECASVVRGEGFLGRVLVICFLSVD